MRLKPSPIKSSKFFLMFSTIHRDAFIVGLCNSLTSVFAGVVVFAILGNLANGRPISEIVSVGC